MKKDLFLYACCLALLTACERNSAPENEWGESVPLSVQELTLTEEAASRVAEGPVTTDGAAIGVFQLAFSGYTPVYNRVYTYSAADGGWSTPDSLWVDMRKAKIVGVYDPNNVGAFPASNTSAVSSAELTAQPYDDTKVWYIDDSYTAVNCFAPSVAFKMKPVYSRLTFSISRHANYLPACKVSRIEFKPASGSFYTAGRLNVADGTLAGTPAGSYVIDTSSLPVNTSGIAAGATDTSIDYLFPAQACSGLTITLTVDGKALSVAIPASGFSAFARGTHYTVQLEITGAGVSGVTIPDSWTATNVNGGNSYIPLP